MGKKEVKIDAIIEALNRDDYVDKFYNKATEYILDPNNKSSEYNGSRKYEKKIEEKNGKTDNKVSEEILEKHFRCYEPCQFSKDEQFRENKSLENILVKVTLLNAFYRTTINNIHLVALARYIQSLDIDSKLANNNGKPNLSYKFNKISRKFANYVKSYNNYEVYGLSYEEVGQGNDGTATDYMSELAHGFKYSSETLRLSSSSYVESKAKLLYNYPIVTMETLTEYTRDVTKFKNEYYNKKVRDLLFNMLNYDYL